MNSKSAAHVSKLGQLLWGFWAWFAFGTCISLALLVALLMPVKRLREKLLVVLSRGVFVLSATPVTLVGIDKLPEGHAVVVANHASYIDGFLLKGYLPARFSFVIKGEMRNIPIAHFILRRAGSRFVERFEAAGSVRDARKIVKAAVGGESLAFFAEGTFQEAPGLGRFRPGAFVAAIKGRMPVVPVAISGTRAMMPGGVRLPKRGPLKIEFLQPILPSDAEYISHRALAEAARQRVLAVLDEPDLCAGDAGEAVAPETQMQESTEDKF